MGDKKHNATLDMLKGISCLLVVTIHVVFPGIFGQLISNGAKIAVPIFFMISGFYSGGGTNNDQKKLFKKAVRTFDLLIASLSVYSVYYIFRHGISQFMTIPFVVEFILRMDYGAIGAYHLWFLTALSLLYVLHSCCNQFINVVTMRVIIILSIIGIIILPDIDSMEYIKNTITQGITFYSIGWLAKNDSLLNRMLGSNRSLKLLGGSSFIIYEGLTVLTVLKIIVRLSNVALLLIYLTAVCLFIWALRNPEIGTENIFTYIGREWSLIIYIVHNLINGIVNILFYRLYVISADEWPQWWRWLNSICVIIISLLCAECIRQIKMKGTLKWKKQ